MLPKETLLSSTPPNPTKRELVWCWLGLASRLGSDWSRSLPVGFKSSAFQVAIGYSPGGSRLRVGAGPSATPPVRCGVQALAGLRSRALGMCDDTVCAGGYFEFSFLTKPSYSVSPVRAGVCLVQS